MCFDLNIHPEKEVEGEEQTFNPRTDVLYGPSTLPVVVVSPSAFPASLTVARVRGVPAGSRPPCLMPSTTPPLADVSARSILPSRVEGFHLTPGFGGPRRVTVATGAVRIGSESVVRGYDVVPGVVGVVGVGVTRTTVA